MKALWMLPGCCALALGTLSAVHAEETVAPSPSPVATPTPPPLERVEPKAPLSIADTLKLLSHQPMWADNVIFSGDTFPKIDFANRDLVTAALGPFTTTIRYFDAAYNEVPKPTAPGRYGAWVEIHFPNGASDTRHATFFKLATKLNYAKEPIKLAVAQYPAAFGLSPEVVARERWDSEDYLEQVVKDDFRRDDNGAVLVAGLHDLQEDPTRWHGFTVWRIEDAWWSGFRKKIMSETQAYQRLVRLPADYDKDPAICWPLLVFLHGSGERGTDLGVLEKQGPMEYLNQGHALPMIVVSPQCPKGQWWSPDKVLGLIEQQEKDYRIDPKRIYVTGLSMGGYGTFDLAATYPEKLAAIAPLAGGANPEIAERIREIPAWIFHGEEDPTVPARYSIAIAERLKTLGVDVRFTLYPGVGHGEWMKTYGDPALYEWLLRQARR